MKSNTYYIYIKLILVRTWYLIIYILGFIEKKNIIVILLNIIGALKRCGDLFNNLLIKSNSYILLKAVVKMEKIMK